jgi:hypothetical protein
LNERELENLCRPAEEEEEEPENVYKVAEKTSYEALRWTLDQIEIRKG